jgi:hypothetical protein
MKMPDSLTMELQIKFPVLYGTRLFIVKQLARLMKMLFDCKVEINVH